MFRTSEAATVHFLRIAAATLVLAFLLVGCTSSESARPASDATSTAAAIPAVLTSTNETIGFWEARVAADRFDTTAYNKLSDAYLRRARQTGDVADYHRAQVALETSLQVLPKGNVDAELQLAFVRVTQHDFDGGLQLAEQALQELPDDPYGLGIVGDAYIALGRYDEADAVILKMAKAAPGLASFSRMATMLELRGDLKQAELTWRNAIDTDAGTRPENTSWARVELGNFYLGHGDLDAAEASYRKALDAYPNYVHAQAGLANVAAARGNYTEAIGLLRDVTARYPIPDYVITLGDIYAAAGKPDDAARQYALVGAIDQLYRANGINTDLQMALFLADQGRDLGQALAAAQAASVERPSIQSSDTLAWALYKSGRYDEAWAASQDALHLGTQSALYYFHAGMIAAKCCDTNTARDYVERALTLNPHFHVLHAAEAQRTLDQLGGKR